VIRVLLADDQALLRSGLRMILDAHADIEVVGEAGDGHEALELARRLGPDLVLMDVQMPVMDGLEATRRLLAGREPHPASSSSPPSTWTSTSTRPSGPARAGSCSRPHRPTSSPPACARRWPATRCSRRR
jgi:CheY-like chemotaxis protein